MSLDLTTTDVMGKLGLTQNEQTNAESGVVPESMSSSEIKRTITIRGITPDSFIDLYLSVDFDFELLMKVFNTYCKDFEADIEEGKASKALEFSAKMIFEMGTYIRNKKNSKGVKAIRFKFPYQASDNTLSVKVVIVLVSTFRDNIYKGVEQEEMILTFKQAGMLAIVTFLKAIKYSYSKNSSILLTPLCRAVFSSESISEMALELRMDTVTVAQMVNASSASGGEYLEQSDLACAIVCVISITKRVSNKDVRNQIISKTIKQYCAKHKKYEPERFAVIAKYALGGVPPGMNAETLIDNFTNIQTVAVNLRARALAMIQSEQVITI